MNQKPKNETELEAFIEDKTSYSAPENWAFIVAQKLVDYGIVKFSEEPKINDSLNVDSEILSCSACTFSCYKDFLKDHPTYDHQNETGCFGEITSYIKKDLYEELVETAKIMHKALNQISDYSTCEDEWSDDLESVCEIAKNTLTELGMRTIEKALLKEQGKSS